MRPPLVPRGLGGIGERARAFTQRHGRKLWWVHSVYALGLGAFVVAFAQKGFTHARWLAVSLGVTWLLALLLFRFFGSGVARPKLETVAAKHRVRFFVMTYVLKNLYQGMLFFLLPFYWKATTFDAPNRWFVFLLGTCAMLSTLDIVFDRFLMRWRVLAALFHGITLFSCLNLVIPALFPDTRTLWTLLWAAGITVVALWTFDLAPGALRGRPYFALMGASVIAGVGVAYVSRVAIPPVPMHVSAAAVGPAVLDDGRLAMEVKTIHTSVIHQLLAVTDIVVPGGRGDRLHHVWRHEGVEVLPATEDTSRTVGPAGTIRLRSALKGQKLPARLVGHWAVDVLTDDRQLVGRTAFTVIE